MNCPITTQMFQCYSHLIDFNVHTSSSSAESTNIELKLSRSIRPWNCFISKIHSQKNLIIFELKKCAHIAMPLNRLFACGGFAPLEIGRAEITETFKAELETRRTSMKQFMLFFFGEI